MEKKKGYLQISLFSCLKENFTNMVKGFSLKSTNIKPCKSKSTKQRQSTKKFCIILDIKPVFQCVSLKDEGI